MKRRAPLIAILIVAAAGGAWWWTRGPSEPAAPVADAPAGSGDKRAAPATQRARPARASIAVTVTDARGPLANATVRFAPDDGEVLVVTTGPNGMARADRVEPGKWQISAAAADHEPAAAQPLELAAGAEESIALVLAAGGRTLSGLVKDVSGGTITGARIEAAKVTAGKPGRAIATAITGADGRYRMTVAEGQLLVAARSADYAAQARYVEVGPAGATADFALVPGGAIEGIVLDEKTRQPMPGARVAAKREAGGLRMFGEPGAHAVAGADGKFRLGGLRPGVYDLDAQTEDKRSLSPTVVGIGVAEQLGGIEILVGVGLAIAGTVVDEAGAPVAGAAISVDGDNRATSDAKGAFALGGLRPGKTTLQAQSAAMLSLAPATVELVDRDLAGVVLRVQRGVTVKGRVEPAQVADVQLEPRGRPGDQGRPLAAVAGADGTFELSPVAPGKAAVSARNAASGDQGTAAIDIAHGMGEVIVKLAPSGSIAGRVVDGDGKGVSGVTVMAAVSGGVERTTIVNGVVTSGIQGFTDAAGNYELKGLAAATYRMQALESGRPARARGKEPVVALGPTEKKTGVNFAIDRMNGVIRGVVLGPDGSPLADAWVSAQQDLNAMLASLTRPPDGPGPSSRSISLRMESDSEGGGASGVAPALTDAQGRFEIRGLAHGAYEVVAEADAGKLRGRAANVTPDAAVTIRTQGVTTLAGTVRGAAGPAALFEVELEGPTDTQRTFTNGAFEIGRVDPGDYTVHVRSRDGNAKTAISVPPGQRTTIEITLVANAVVVGMLVDAAGAPIADAPLVVVDQIPGERPGEVKVTMSGAPDRTGPDGRFRIERQPGTCMLFVLTEPPVRRRDLKLEAGKTLDVGQVRVEKPAEAPPREAPPRESPRVAPGLLRGNSDVASARP